MKVIIYRAESEATNHSTSGGYIGELAALRKNV